MFLNFLIGDIVKKEWVRMFYFVVLVLITGSWIFLVYLNMVFLIWILLYVVLESRVISEVKLMLMVFIIWFRDVNFDVIRGIWFYFNYFILFIEVGDIIKEKEFKDYVCIIYGKIISFFGLN